MFQRFCERKKWFDYINPNNIEVILAFLFSIIISVILMFLDIYGNVKYFHEAFKNLLLYFIGGFIGTIGFVLAGMAIIIGMFSKSISKKIDQINGEKSIVKLLTSYEFLAFNLCVEVITLTIVYIILSSPQGLISKHSYYAIIFIVIYSIMFNLFYTVSLVGNCIKFYQIYITYSIIENSEKSLYEQCNEIRIDYILNTLIKSSKISNKDFPESISEFIELNKINNKQEIKEYILNYYKKDN